LSRTWDLLSIRNYRKVQGLRRSEQLLGVLLVTPAFGIISLLFFYPLVFNIWLSFQKPIFGTLDYSFVGVENYLNIFSDNIFWLGLINSILFTGSSVVLQLIFGLGLALALNQQIRGRGIARTLAIIPWAVPVISTSFIWQWMYYSDGVLNYVLERLGFIQSRFPWLSNMNTAMAAVIIASVWRLTPFVFVTLLAGLQQIPPELYEVVDIDGGGSWVKFRYVTLPALRGVILIVVVLRVLWTFTWFDLIYLLTGGGPANATVVLPVIVYQRAFLGSAPGLAATISTLIMLILISLAYLYLRLRRE
jgi:multiple sugar transport system permease protein